MSGLYNHTNRLSADFVTMVPPSKVLRTDMGPYPGGTPYLTDNIVQSSSINMTSGNNTNGVIHTTINTRTKDQKLINSHQMAFYDARDELKPVLRSLQSVNNILANSREYQVSEFDQANARHIKKSNYYDSIKGVTNVTKSRIMDQFQFLGIVTNNDTDTKMDKYKGRLPRSFTVTTWGATHVLDYWSNEDKILNGYSHCFLILKQVKVYRDNKIAMKNKAYNYQPYKFQENLNTFTRDSGESVEFLPGEKYKYIWQFVPFFNNDSEIETKDYTFTNSDGELEIGSYIYVGYVHEYPVISNTDVLRKRNETSVARDVVYLHENAVVKPMQFFVLKDNRSRLI